MLKNKAAYYLVFIYCCFTLVLPAYFFNKLVFSVVFIFSILIILSTQYKLKTISPFFILIIFLYSFIVSFNFPVTPSLRIQLMLVAFTPFIIYFLDFFRVDINRIVINSSLVLVFSTFLLYYSDQSGNEWLSSIFLQFSQVGVGSRDVGLGVVNFYRIGSVPFLFVGFSLVLQRLYLEKRISDIFYIFIIAVVIVMSSTRSIQVGCILIVAFVLFRKHLVFTILFTLLCGFYFLLSGGHTVAIFDVSDSGNAIKLGHLNSFLDWLEPTNFFFGEGLASNYYSMGNGRHVAQTEVTLLDNFRYFGVPLTVIFYLSLLFPVMNKLPWRVDGGFPFSVMCIYILMSLTNPMLINSFGLVIVLWYWSNILREA